MSTDKMNIAEVYEMFETIKSKLDKRADKSAEPKQIDLTVVNAMREERIRRNADEAEKLQEQEEMIKQQDRTKSVHQ
jgi:hypothetical protein